MNSRAVLVVDDEPIMRFCLERLLRAEGFMVRAVADMAAAVDCLTQGRPDVVVVDIVDDTADDYALCHRLREVPGCGDLRVVMVSARAQLDTVERGLAAGANGYLMKPFAVQTLTRTIDAVLANRQA